jgi:glycosyltransferase involved in cell wall biosynthesis
MNIAIFTNNYLPCVNGVVRSVENFRQEIEKRGHNVYIFAPEFTPNEHKDKVFYSKALKIFEKPEKGFYPIPLTNVSKIEKIIQELQIDIIHSQHPIFLGTTALRCSQRLKIPLVYTNHTLYHECVKFPFPLIENMIKEYVVSFVVEYANQCQRVIAPSMSVKKMLLQMGVKTPIVFIPSGINLEQFNRPDSCVHIRKKYNLQADDILLLLVSRLSYEKNILFLISAFRNVYHNNKKIFLLIVGEGLYRKKIEKEIDLLGVKNVILTGRVDYSKIFCYYKASDIFVCPFLLDSQSLVIVEAMAAGLPVVALKQSIGPREMIGKTGAGFLVDESEEKFAHIILKLAADADLRARCSQQAIKQAEKYSSQRAAIKMIELYSELVK